MLFGVHTIERSPRMPRTHRPLSRAVVVAVLLLASPAFPNSPDIPILVDGVPMDARAIAIRGEVYVPAWILENYSGTKVEWIRPANLLEILSASKPRDPVPSEGKLKVKVGSYLASEGFVVGTSMRLYLLNIDPKEFRFPDGRSAADRAHEGTISRIGTASTPAREYLQLSPTDRFTPKGWGVIARMPKEEISVLPSLVEQYEALYNTVYYDLLTNLVLDMDQRVRELGTLDPQLQKITIQPILLGEDGVGTIRSKTGIRFLFGRMLYGNRQVVWNVPVVIRGAEETLVELSHRNAVVHQ